LKRSERFERFEQQWLILLNEILPTPFSKRNQRDNAGKTALNKVLDECYKMTSFFVISAIKTIERPSMQQAFQNA